MNFLLKSIALACVIFSCKIGLAGIASNDPVLRPIQVPPGQVTVKIQWKVASSSELLSACPRSPTMGVNAGCVVRSGGVCTIYTGSETLTHVVLGERMIACSR